MLKKFLCTGFFLAGAAVLSAASASLETAGRTAFARNEKDAVLKIRVKAQGGDLSDLKLRASIGGIPCGECSAALLKSGDSAVLELPMETRLSKGEYKAELTLNAGGLDKPATFGQKIFIGPELHDSMPVLIWGYWPIDHKVFQDLGFTHAQSNYWRKQDYTDRMMFDGFRGMHHIHLGTLKGEKVLRIQRNGKPYADKNAMNAADPANRKDLYDFTYQEAQKKLSEAPAVEGALINSERRDHTALSFDKASKEAFQQFAGYPIPQEVNEKTGVDYRFLKKFPASRVIPDDDPILTYYKWFWKDGDGWNGLNDTMAQAYRDALRRPFWTFYDPAVRVPPVWGSGGNVDVISHWIYATPDPINIGATTAELQAMAKGNPNQKVMNMTQIIVYRSAVAPVGKKVKNMPAWAAEYPKSPYITLAPDMMKIAVWTQISRQVQGIMFHGAFSLIPNSNKGDKSKGYHCTNPETAGVLGDFLLNVVKPLGPALKRVPERKGEVAILESFASAMFAGRITWGWRNWPYEAHLAALWGGLAPVVLYDETILRDGLGDIKVLILPGCDVLTEKVCRAILDFQEKGGIVVGDASLVPAITPDITLTEYQRIKDPQADKAALQKIGQDLKKALEPYYRTYSESSDPDLMTWVRTSGSADYLFVINDKRTFGDYFGPWKVVMEKSVPNQGSVQLRRKAAAVYDLVTHQEVPFSQDGERMTVPVDFDGVKTGSLYLVLPEKIKQVTLTLPKSAVRGKTFAFTAGAEFSSGAPVESVHPIAVEVRDASGKLTDDSCSAALVQGKYEQTVTVPLNAERGKWKITIRDLASGKSVEKAILIR